MCIHYQVRTTVAFYDFFSRKNNKTILQKIHLLTRYPLISFTKWSHGTIKTVRKWVTLQKNPLLITIQILSIFVSVTIHNTWHINTKTKMNQHGSFSLSLWNSKKKKEFNYSNIICLVTSFDITKTTLRLNNDTYR